MFTEPYTNVEGGQMRPALVKILIMIGPLKKYSFELFVFFFSFIFHQRHSRSNKNMNEKNSNMC